VTALPTGSAWYPQRSRKKVKTEYQANTTHSVISDLDDHFTASAIVPVVITRRVAPSNIVIESIAIPLCISRRASPQRIASLYAKLDLVARREVIRKNKSIALGCIDKIIVDLNSVG
jgi:hypothetical protein